jgi:hypothetical protein
LGLDGLLLLACTAAHTNKSTKSTQLTENLHMQRRTWLANLSLISGLYALGSTCPAWAFELSNRDATLGLRTALERGAVAAVGLLGKNGGFLDNPKVRIPLPGVLNDAAKLLQITGQQKRVDDLIIAMNRAAEAAVPQAQALLVSAVKAMSIDDARKILNGGDNSATQFFAGKTRDPLGLKFLPIVTKATEKVALAEKYNSVAGKAASMGLLNKDNANVQQYVTTKALDGLFLIIGEEERKIRENPAAAGSAILKKVFGSLK